MVYFSLKNEQNKIGKSSLTETSEIIQKQCIL